MVCLGLSTQGDTEKDIQTEIFVQRCKSYLEGARTHPIWDDLSFEIHRGCYVSQPVKTRPARVQVHRNEQANNGDFAEERNGSKYLTAQKEAK